MHRCEPFVSNSVSSASAHGSKHSDVVEGRHDRHLLDSVRPWLDGHAPHEDTGVALGVPLRHSCSRNRTIASAWMRRQRATTSDAGVERASSSRGSNARRCAKEGPCRTPAAFQQAGASRAAPRTSRKLGTGARSHVSSAARPAAVGSWTVRRGPRPGSVRTRVISPLSRQLVDGAVGERAAGRPDAARPRRLGARRRASVNPCDGRLNEEPQHHPLREGDGPERSAICRHSDHGLG